MAQVNVSVAQETKQEWEDYIEETGEYGTLSALVRTAVQNEISENEEQPVPEEISNLATNVEDIKESLARIEDRLEWIEDESAPQGVTDLANDLLKVMEPLPSGPSTADSSNPPLESSGNLSRKEAAATVVQQVGPQTPQALAEEVDSSEKRVETALTHLKEQFLVDEVTIDGETHYFRVD